MNEEIGLVHKTFRVANDILTLGGSARLREVNEKLEFQAKLYSQVLAQITSLEDIVKGQLGR